MKAIVTCFTVVYCVRSVSIGSKCGLTSDKVASVRYFIYGR